MAPKKAAAKAETPAVAKAGAKTSIVSATKSNAGNYLLPRGCEVGEEAAFHAFRGRDSEDITDYLDAIFEFCNEGEHNLTREEFDSMIKDSDEGGWYMSYCEHVTETDATFKVGDWVLLSSERWYYGMNRVSWDARAHKKCLQNVSAECGNPFLPSFLESFFKEQRAADWDDEAIKQMFAHEGEEYHGEGDDGLTICRVRRLGDVDEGDGGGGGGDWINGGGENY